MKLGNHVKTTAKERGREGKGWREGEHVASGKMRAGRLRGSYWVREFGSKPHKDGFGFCWIFFRRFFAYVSFV